MQVAPYNDVCAVSDELVTTFTRQELKIRCPHDTYEEDFLSNNVDYDEDHMKPVDYCHDEDDDDTKPVDWLAYWASLPPPPPPSPEEERTLAYLHLNIAMNRLSLDPSIKISRRLDLLNIIASDTVIQMIISESTYLTHIFTNMFHLFINESPHDDYLCGFTTFVLNKFI